MVVSAAIISAGAVDDDDGGVVAVVTCFFGMARRGPSDGMRKGDLRVARTCKRTEESDGANVEENNSPESQSEVSVRTFVGGRFSSLRVV